MRRVLQSRGIRVGVIMAAVLALATAAFAYFTSTGTGTASASVGNLGTPTVSATPGAGTVALSWTTVTPPSSGAVSYYVMRDGGAPSANCPTSASPGSGTNCTDTGVSAGQHSYTVTAVWRSWTGTSSSKTVTLSSGAIDHLVVSGYANPTTAGVSHSVVVTAKDASGNTVTSYTGTIHFTSSDGAATLPSDYTFVSGDNGAHSFNATLKTAGSQSITATDTVTGSITGSQSSIVVSPTNATTLVVSGFTSPSTAGVSHNFTVTAKDQFGNTATGYAGAVHFTSSDGAAVLPSNYSFVAGDNGTHTFSATLKTAGSQSISATDTGTSSIAGSQTGITVNAAGAATLSVSGYPASTTAGVSHNLTVTAKDQFGNTATAYTGTIHFTSSDGSASLPSDYTFVSGDNGAHTFSATLKTAGSQSITATDTVTGSITGNQTGITVAAANASTLTVAGYPTSTTAGVSHTFTVTAKDAFGNTATGYTGTIHFTSTDGAATLPADYTFLASDNGTHGGFSATLQTSGTQSITATDKSNSGITGSQTSIVVSAAAATTLSVTGYPSPATSGVSQSFTVTAKDQFGNTATGYRGTVHFTSSDTSAALPANYAFVAGDNGTHTFTATLKTAGSQSITAADTVTGTITGSQTAITITASQLVITAASTTPTAGAADNLTITAKDAAGNTAANYTGDKQLTFSGASTAPDGTTHPTVTDKSQTATAFGTLETLTFSGGTASSTVGATGQAVMKLYKAETASISVSDGAISSPGVAITVAVAATTPTGGTYTDPGSGGQDTITGTTSATTKVAATETQGPNVNSTYNTTSAANGSFTLNVDNVSGSSQNQIPVAYSVVAIDAWGNRTSAATMSGTDKH